MPSNNPYGLAMSMRRNLYRSGILKAAKVGVPVISVGNLTVGGTGKTPITKLVVQYLRDRKHIRVAIVMRGYRRQTKGLLVVSDGTTNFADTQASGDEAQVYAQELSDVIVICDEERVRGARKAIELGAEVIVLDDGYQHQALHRDLNILLIAAGEVDGAMIPFGRFREPTSAAADADIILITGSDGDDFLSAETAIARYPLKDRCIVLHAITRLRGLVTLEEKDAVLSELKGRRVLALSSIAKPERFQAMLRNLGAEVEPYPLPDHAAYDAKRAEEIFSVASSARCEIIVQTTKDSVKSTPFLRGGPLRVYTLEIEYLLEEGARFFERIDNALLRQTV